MRRKITAVSATNATLIGTRGKSRNLGANPTSSGGNGSKFGDHRTKTEMFPTSIKNLFWRENDCSWRERCRYGARRWIFVRNRRNDSGDSAFTALIARRSARIS